MGLTRLRPNFCLQLKRQYWASNADLTGGSLTIPTCFAMPKPVNITGRSSSITNSFVNAITPVMWPSEAEVTEALAILELDAADLRCVYCGDRSTEWDHLRPLVRGKQPTGYVSEIANLVPACGKCNQSKGAQHWETWMRGAASRSPATRGIPDLEGRITRIRTFERWRTPRKVDFEALAGPELWTQHWQNYDRLQTLMCECQAVADQIRVRVQDAEA